MAEVASTETRRALDWVVQERLILWGDDLRCPHQRFAAVVLGKIIEGQDATGRNLVGRLLEAVLADPAMPLAGLYVLLQELGRAGHYGQWTTLLPSGALQPALDRAWSADTSELRGEASYLLTQAEPYLAYSGGDKRRVSDINWIR
jgi:hypothetical protein